MTKFKQRNHKTGETHVIIILRDGHWHSYLPPVSWQGLEVHVTLEGFQKYFGCSDEELEMIKLKYGSPKDAVMRAHIQHAGAKKLSGYHSGQDR